MEKGMQRKTAARLLAVQGLYQRTENAIATDMDTQRQIEELLRLYQESEKGIRPNRTLLEKLLEGVAACREEIDGMIGRSVHEKHALVRMLPLQKAMLQAAAYELSMLQETPARVVLDEYVTIAHAFLSDEETGFVNGVLDRMAHELRASEFS